MTNNLPFVLLRFRRLLVVAVQLLLVAVSYWAAFALRFDSHPPDWAWQAMLESLPWLVAIRGLTFLPFRLYEGLWKYTSLYDLELLLGGVLVSTLIFAGYVWSPLGPAAFPRSIMIVDALIVTLVLGGIRMTRRLVAELSGQSGSGKAAVLIYGAGDAGEMIVREMRQNASLGYRPVGFIDDDPGKIGRRIHGVRVLGSRADITSIMDRVEPSEVLLAVPSVTPDGLREIFRLFEPYKLQVKTLPALSEIIRGRPGLAQVRTLKVEDLLDRAPVGLNSAPLKQLVHGRSVLVTGAGGSIGSELCRQILDLHPRTLVLFERYENSLHAIRLELEDRLRAWPEWTLPVVRAVVGDVTDEALVRSTMEAHRPDLVFHAAAHKHVPLMEENPCEAIKNNVRGTRVMAAAAEEAGVDRFILISTDKAANPTSIMGASKRIAELVVQAQAAGSGTSYAIVRFGNVLGSNGSVVPRFLEQIHRGGPVTVTHPDVRRFFMLIPEAVQLVLHAAAEARSGATYVLDMGEQIRVADMARNLIRLAGKIPDEDIQIVFTGLRPGEKLAEELIGGGEHIAPSNVPKVSVVTRNMSVPDTFVPDVASLEAAATLGDVAQTTARLRTLAAMSESTATAVDDAAQNVRPARPIAKPKRVAAAPTVDAQACPRCGQWAHRSRARRFDQHLRKRLTNRRLYRCSHCHWRGWLVPADLAGIQPAVAPVDVIDLKALDQPAPARDSRPGFSPKDLS